MTRRAPAHSDAGAAEIDALRARLAEAEETLRAIRHGEVDALLVSDGSGDRVYTLRSADAPYRTLVEQMQEGAVTLTLAGAIVYANRSFATLVGMPLERVIGSTIDEYVEAAEHDALRALLAAGLGTLRTQLRARSGTALDVHISVSDVAIDDVEHRTLIVTDLSTLTRVQRESRSKDDFLAMLAHELRNPLAPIRTGLQVLRLSPGGEAAERVREMMDRQVAQMVRLIDDLLDVSRINRGKIELKRELIDVRTVIGLAVETTLPVIEAGRHELQLRIPPDPLMVHADPVRLAQVFGNLLNNAAKYTPDGGQLEVDVVREGSRVSVAIRDTGVGIPAEMLPGVFELFSQAGRSLDRAQGGLGIGLTLVRRLTEMHGGTVEAASPGLGRGSTFTVSVPLVGDRDTRPVAAGPDDGEAAGPGPPARRLRVLVVDDNADGASTLSMLVGLRGHETAVAHDGPEALTMLAAFTPHLVICDIGLPGLDGYEIARRVRAVETARGGGRTALVSLTGWGSDEDKHRSLEAGFDLHLTKPIDPKEVEALLDRTCKAFCAPGAE
jgi:PAS domain S-box-containing protein